MLSYVSLAVVLTAYIAPSVATPPACLLACASKVVRSSSTCNELAQITCVCENEASAMQSCLETTCPNDLASTAYSSFESICEGLNADIGSSNSSSSAVSSSSSVAPSTSLSSSSSYVASSSTEASSTEASSTESSSAPASSTESSSTEVTSTESSSTFSTSSTTLIPSTTSSSSSVASSSSDISIYPTNAAAVAGVNGALGVAAFVAMNLI